MTPPHLWDKVQIPLLLPDLTLPSSPVAPLTPGTLMTPPPRRMGPFFPDTVLLTHALLAASKVFCPSFVHLASHVATCVNRSLTRHWCMDRDFPTPIPSPSGSLRAGPHLIASMPSSSTCSVNIRWMNKPLPFLLNKQIMLQVTAMTLINQKVSCTKMKSPWCYSFCYPSEGKAFSAC